MVKGKFSKLDPTKIFSINANETLLRPKTLSFKLENRGEDFKLEFTETYKEKQPPANQEWLIDKTLGALERIREIYSRRGKYFIHQVKAIKKGYEVMIVSDEGFALIAGVLAEVIGFGITEREDLYSLQPFLEGLLKQLARADIQDE